MKAKPIRIAITQTRNAFAPMPARTADLPQLAGRLDEIRDANLKHNEALIAAAAKQGAQLVCCSELCTAPYFALEERAMWRELAEDARQGPSSRFFRRVAKQYGVIVIAPIYEKDGSKRFNTALVIDENGELLGCYRKTHIPQGSNDVASFFESFYYEASDGTAYLNRSHTIGSNRYFPVFKTSLGRIGIAICYDRHFDGVMRSLARAGAEMILCPAITFGSKSRRMWRAEATTDACRYNLFIACGNRSGTEAPFDVSYYGDGFITGPNGECSNISKDAELIIADLNLAARQHSDPAGWKLIRDRRDNIYG